MCCRRLLAPPPRALPRRIAATICRHVYIKATEPRLPHARPAPVDDAACRYFTFASQDCCATALRCRFRRRYANMVIVTPRSSHQLPPVTTGLYDAACRYAPMFAALFTRRLRAILFALPQAAAVLNTPPRQPLPAAKKSLSFKYCRRRDAPMPQCFHNAACCQPLRPRLRYVTPRVCRMLRVMFILSHTAKRGTPTCQFFTATPWLRDTVVRLF